MKKALRNSLVLILSLIFLIPSSYASEEYKKPKDLKMAKLLFGGDVLPHINFDEYALTYGGDRYNYDNFFMPLSSFTKDSDLFIVNCEFTSNPNLAPSGYPTFNSNHAIYGSLNKIGVDVITTANNHALDTGIKGLDSTIDAINHHGIDHVGTRKNPKKRYLIKEVNGINVGILAYAEQLNGLDYLLDTKEKQMKIDTLDPLTIKKDIENILKEGAEFVIIYPHWGVEYSSYPEDYQIKLAQAMIDWGADMVIGNHPHVIQPREEYESIDGRKGIIYYSLGNLISNQNHKYFNGDYRVEQGLIVESIIYKYENDKRAKILNTTYHSVCTDTSYDEYGLINKSYVTDDYENIFKNGDMTRSLLDLMKQARKMTYETMHTKVEGPY